MVQPTRPWPNPPPIRVQQPGPWDPITRTNWKKVFAFLPKEIRGERVWLKFVYKRIYRSPTGIRQDEYGDIFDVMKADYDRLQQ